MLARRCFSWSIGCGEGRQYASDPSLEEEEDDEGEDEAEEGGLSEGAGVSVVAELADFAHFSLQRRA